MFCELGTYKSKSYYLKLHIHCNYFIVNCATELCLLYKKKRSALKRKKLPVCVKYEFQVHWFITMKSHCTVYLFTSSSMKVISVIRNTISNWSTNNDIPWLVNSLNISIIIFFIFISRLPTQVLVFASIITLNNAQFQIQPTQQSSGFLSSQQNQVQSPEQDLSPASAVNYRTQVQTYEYDEEEEDVPQATPQQPIRRQQQPFVRSQNQKGPNQKQILEELEEEEPDRLGLLLEKSSFNCDGRTG